MRWVKFLITISIIYTALIGDYIVFRSKYSDSPLFKAVADSAVHATIGFLSGCLFSTHLLNIPAQNCVYYILVCTVVSALIDIDHVFVAKSFHIKDLTNLKQRGLLHCSSLWALFTMSLLTYSFMAKKLNINILAYILIVAFTSHHLRDGNRRGLWIYPYGHTAPINTYVYVTLSAILPYVFAYTFVCMKHVFNVKDYNVIQTV